ncbi:MAG: YceI family protein [Chloroflexi bacterium]|nr:YceI family protein [Chloroflexota bacterium]MCY3582934.1 YceI family protein [Chloroflexota bacterium]MCY3715916.1 YceI family protein [Chloroflexota bacterium]MDE2649699.1 YceI family protein [Chloroflexota bacterium]
MANGRIALLLIVALLMGAAGGIFGYIYITGGSGEPSMSVEEALATRQADEALVREAVGTAVAQAANEIIPAALGAAMQAERARQPITFNIVPAESQASFTVEEDLRGVRTTVVGLTSDVGGAINVVLGDPAASSIGDILISARTLRTDNDMRNRALRSRILFSAQDENEFIVFEPRELSNFSADSIAVGETIRFDISGDLTVRGATQTLTFAAQVTLDHEDQISGSAATTVLYADFGLSIPDVPSVSWVADEVELRLDFVARSGR